MPTFSDERITFIHIPKTGGVSITRWLDTHIKRRVNWDNPYDHSFLNEIKNSAPVVFAVVRNPWDRMASMFSYYKWNAYLPSMAFQSFEEFLRDLPYKHSFGQGKTFVTPQKRWIDSGVTHVLRFENLDEDFKVIQDILGCHEPLGKENASKHDHYRTFYTDKTRKLVGDMFKEDVEAFGYEF